ncbi:MAG: hypothetical protein IPP73_08350 [Chitinophagaceae bacterium]|nr:hypothetical protein [Chitinophagaceae bacterium]
MTRITRILPALYLSICLLSCKHSQVVEHVQEFNHYPSASAVAYYNRHLYMMGDDAPYCLVLDTSLVQKDSIPLFQSTLKKIPKDSKPDLESATVVQYQDEDQLLLLGSGSKSPQRDLAILYSAKKKKADSIRLDTFFTRLRALGIGEINIEGCTKIPGRILMSNRGSLGNPRNDLIISKSAFWDNQTETGLTTIRFGVQPDSTSFSGVSGLEYSSLSDRLIATVSTEATTNAMDDGAIGKSYLWIVKNFSSKTKWKAINPDEIIDLEAEDPRFKGHKIESVCLLAESRTMLHLLLVADDDNGSSTVFTLALEK